MIKEFSYKFSQLTVNPSDIAVLLGYKDGILPEPFSEYLAEAIIRAESLNDIRGAIFVSDQFRFSDNNAKILIEKVELNIGKTVGKELRNSESIILFICTAGKEISEWSANLLLGDDPVLGYIYDVLGSVIVEAAMDKIHQEIKRNADDSGKLVTNRYSPGYCQWSLADQHKLFSFFPDNCGGISLTDSALMHPVKSVSGIIGMGKTVKFRQYTCDLCSLTDCFYRSHQKQKPSVLD